MAADDPDARSRELEKRLRQQEAAWREWHQRRDSRFVTKLMIGIPAITTFLVCILAVIHRDPQWSTTQVFGLQFAAVAAFVVSQIVNMWPVPGIRDWRTFPTE